MTNSNCLAGIACPKCGNDGLIYIEAITMAAVTDDGAETFGDIEWDGSSHDECPDCQHRGTLDEFRIDPATQVLTPTDKEQ